MDKQKIDQKIDTAAENAKETISLLGERLDRATRCAQTKSTQVKDSLHEGVRKAADKVEEAVSAAADHIRTKAGK